MANKGHYLEALLDLGQAATVREVHAHALKLFGPEVVQGDRSSCRLSLERHRASGRVTKQAGKYELTEAGRDPVSYLNARIRNLEAEVGRLQEENYVLRLKIGGGS